jgi:hypothetical protein
LKIEGSAEVRRLFASFSSEGEAASSLARNELKDTPAARRQAPRTVSVIVMMFVSYEINVETAALGCPSSAARCLVCVAWALLPATRSISKETGPTKKPRRSGARFHLNPILLCRGTHHPENRRTDTRKDNGQNQSRPSKQTQNNSREQYYTVPP